MAGGLGYGRALRMAVALWRAQRMAGALSHMIVAFAIVGCTYRIDVPGCFSVVCLICRWLLLSSLPASLLVAVALVGSICNSAPNTWPEGLVPGVHCAWP